MVPECAPEDIHDFRITVKKLKAIIRLFNGVSTRASACRFPKSLNKVYKTLGFMRECQIQKQKILKAAKETGSMEPLIYLNKINRKTELFKQKVIRSIQSLPDVNKKRDQIINDCSEEITDASITRYIQTKMNAIQLLLLNRPCDDEHMHEMRKKIKDIQYIFSGVAKNDHIDVSSSRLRTIQRVSAELGEFHDLCIAIVLLKKELKLHDKERDEQKILRKTKVNWLTEKKRLHQQIIESIELLIRDHVHEFSMN